MIEFMNQTLGMSSWELIATLLSLAYVILAAKGHIACWPAAFLSTLIFTLIFFQVNLLMDSILNVYYMAMAVFGFWQWRKHKLDTFPDNAFEEQLDVVSWSIKQHVKWIIPLIIVSIILGYYMANQTAASYPYLDTFTTVFAIYATYLITQRVVENWLYWIIIDIVSVYLYMNKSLMIIAVLFMLYTVIACWGYFQWRVLLASKKPTKIAT
ncbi:nicotinamide riboside transporter PnuC [Algibacillus agarilyticus]|uniref:nicotinamide riboside transporter PnuC n=1 Tax=Algibacillus agarilyticus TaxID=2234133 RepID=UPI000DD0E80E|nr:nicotinamide riboside transporter PnuC [Algibacillus agarilyticus]